MLLYEHSSFIDQLLGSNVHYRVPLYQRRYIWNEMNWDTLWKEILFQLKVKEQQEEEDHPTHFMGPIVTRSIGKKAYEVIDGQQRLATFQIILCVIRDICNTQDDPQKLKLASSAAKYIVNDEDVLIDDPDYEFTFIPTAHDQPAFSRITSKEYGQNRTNSDGHSILKAYDHFADLIQEYVGDNLDFEKMRRLLRSITDRFSFIHINLRSEDEHPAKVFASINATGRKLSEFDYLRNDLFLRAANKAEDFYEDYWDFEKDPDYWKEHRCDSFFRTFLMAKQGPDCFEKGVQPFEVYQQYREDLTTGQGIEYEFKQLKSHAETHKDINSKSSGFDWPGHLRALCGILDIPSLDPFILFIAVDNESNIDSVCHILNSYIVRRLFFCDDVKVSYETINTYFSKAIINGFNLKAFQESLSKTWPNCNPAEGFQDAKSKDPVLIDYILNELQNWSEVRSRSTSLTNQKLSLEDIEKILMELDDINKDTASFEEICKFFDEIWQPSWI